MLYIDMSYEHWRPVFAFCYSAIFCGVCYVFIKGIQAIVKEHVAKNRAKRRHPATRTPRRDQRPTYSQPRNYRENR